MSLMVEKLAYLKKLRRLTTEQAAQLTGVPVGTLNKIFSGQTRRPAAEHLAKLARLFRVSMCYLLDDEIPPERCYAAQSEEGLFSLSAEEARLLGERLIEETRSIRWRDQDIGVCCSLGICRCCCAVPYDRLYLETDRSLYRAKREGKGRCCYWQITRCGTEAAAAP